jgi:hypothetical protein
LFKAQLSSDGSAVTIKFACVNGGSYSIEKASSVGGSYESIGTVDASDTGYAEFTDSAAGNGPNYYRVVQQ